MPIRRSPNGAGHSRPQPGRDRPEQVVAINRNAWSQSIGISGRNQPVRTRPQHCATFRIDGHRSVMDPLRCVYRVQGRAGLGPATVVTYRDGEYLLTGPQQHKVSRRHRPRSLVLASTSGL